MLIKQADGTEIEVFTAEEATAKVKEAVDAATAVATKAATDTAAARVTELETKHATELKEAKKPVVPPKKEGDKKEEGDKKKEEEGDQLTAQEVIDQAKTAATEQVDTFKKDMMKDHREELLDTYAGKDDAERRTKMEAEFDAYKPDDMSKTGMEDRMKAAATIMDGKAPTPGGLDNIGDGGERGDRQTTTPAVGGKDGVSGEVMDLAKKMGIEADTTAHYSEKK